MGHEHQQWTNRLEKLRKHRADRKVDVVAQAFLVPGEKLFHDFNVIKNVAIAQNLSVPPISLHHHIVETHQVIIIEIAQNYLYHLISLLHHHC